MNSCHVNNIIVLVTLIAGWGCTGKSDLVDRSPEAELKRFRFADPDMQITLVSAEPDVVSPVAMAWSPDGDLYVAEMPGYPVTENTGRIKKLQDSDGDGYYQLTSMFAEGLNFPNSVMWYDGGILVTDAPDIYFLKDTTDDGIADVKKVLLKGFEPGNEQLRANSLFWGLDNWIYGANGRSGGSIYFMQDSTSKVSIDSRDFRFRLNPPQFEAISGMSQYGLTQDSWGNRFISYNHRFARQVVLEEKHLKRSPALTKYAVFDTYQSEHDRRVYTLLEEAMRFNRDPIGYFTSLSGLTAYRGNLLGSDYQGDLFAGESVQAAVIHRSMRPDGPVYKAIDIAPGYEFLASDDSWFHPVNFANGPDGALYMVDFYRMLVEHPEWAHDDLKEGVDWKFGEENGRIWRITAIDAPWDASRSRPDFESLGPLQLAKQLTDASGWRRSMAQQLLVHQNSQEALPHLEQLLVYKKPETRVHALWTLHGLDLLEDAHIETALHDDVPQVQVQAIHLAEDRLATSKLLVTKIAAFATSHDDLVRFHSILALGHVDLPGARIALTACGRQFDDSWTRVALLSSVSSWAGDFTQSLLADDANENKSEEDQWFFRQLGALTAATDETITSFIGGAELNQSQLAFLAGYLKSSAAGGMAPPSFSNQFWDRILTLANDPNDEQQASLAIELLGHAGSDLIHQKLLQTVLTSDSETIQSTGVKTLALLNEGNICHQLFNKISSFDPSVRKQVISSALSSDAAAFALLSAIENAVIDHTEIPEELRHALLAHANETIQSKAEGIIGAAVNSDRQAVVDQYLASLDKQTVDLKNGAKIFLTHCSVCHAINGTGGLLGPDLTNIGSRSDEVLMVNILDPSRMVSYELKLHVLTTNTGEVYSGTISAETTSSITVRQPDGTEHTILKENIRKNTGTEQSIMPEGFERIINENEMADLIGFLRQPVSISD